MKKKIHFIVNPISGRHNKETFPDKVSKLINKELFDYYITYTEHPGHGEELAKKSVSDGIDIVAAVGGDGTINEIARCLIDTEVALGIIPFGSGNGLAHHLRLPLNIEKAIKEVINNGFVTKIDTATINGNSFVSIAGIGFDALIADSFAKDPNRGLKTYLKIITEEYPFFEPEHYKLTFDDDITIECTPLFISFANANQFGFNAAVSPKASLNDGFLDVCVFRKPYLIEVPFVAGMMMTQMIDKSNNVDIYKVKKINVIREKNGIANVDGEVVEMEKDIEVKIKELSLNVLIPRIF